jgi:Ca-activated chloride channel family protein
MRMNVPSFLVEGRRRTTVGIVAPILAACTVTLAGGSGPARQFSSGVNLVEAYVTVTDGSGEPVTGLQVSDFEIFDDGQPQAVQAFAAGDFPLSIALAVDHSASMAGARLRLATAAARSFLGRLRSSDQVMVVGVSSEVEVLAPLSTDRTAQVRAIERLQPWSTTSLNDAIVAGLDLIQPAAGRRGLIVLSDGEDRYSEATPGQVLSSARRAGVMVYAVALGKRLPPLFPELAVATGGRSFHADDPRRLEPVLSQIARELRFQYLIGYAPPDRTTPQPPASEDQPRWHSIQVRVKRPGVQVRFRDGYFGR